MTHLPEFEGFARLAAGADFVPVYRRLLSDALTPVSGLGKLDDGGMVCLFESVIGGEKVGRYSFIACQPFLVLEAFSHEVRVTENGSTTTFEAKNPLEELRQRVTAMRVADHPDLPPFVGGAIGYAGYDTVRYVERLPNAPPDDRQLADLSFGFFDHMVVFDNVQKTVLVLVLADVRGGAGREGANREAYDKASRRVDELVAKLSEPSGAIVPLDVEAQVAASPSYKANFTQPEYERAVERCVEYIRAGDIFQVVLSQRLELKLDVDPLEVYRRLRVVNPSPFMFFVRTPGCTLVGSSPEIMVRVVDGRVTVRPLAGTRPRGVDDAHDEALAAELLDDPKERAEHVMLVDLGRNDVGRVAQFGTVETSDVMVIERYSHVMHITSNVNGQLREGCDAFDALAACLPAGTVSGAPKVRAMQIIDELEPHRRGPYAGAVGYIDFAGNMDTCIALRTLVVKDNKAWVQAGAGIVADSVPAAEYQETLNKARGLLRAIELAQATSGTKTEL